MWVMTEHRVNESWVKLFSFVQNGPVYLTPLAYSKSRDMILFEKDRQKLVWYDLKRILFICVKIHSAPRAFGAKVFQGSLVSPHVGNGRDGRKQDTEEKMKRKRKNR